MTFIDFFSGVGGFTRGMQLVGHECIGHCEIDKFAEASYRSMHCINEDQREYLSTLSLKERQKEILKEEYLNGEWYADDVGTIDSGTIPTADCWCFGFPCQDISIAGLQRGFSGDRSSLFFRVMHLLGELREGDRPKYLFIENVKNLISIHSGFDFGRVLASLDEGGYDAEWRVINSKDYGVPQNRERVFIIGRIRGRGIGEILPIGESDQEAAVVQGFGVDAVGNVNPSGNGINGMVYSPKGLSPTLTTNKGEGPKIISNAIAVMTECVMKVKTINPKTGQKETSIQHRVYDESGIAPSLNRYTPPKWIEPIAEYYPVLTPDRVEKRQNGRRFKEDGEPMFTLTSQDRHGIMIKEATSKGFAEAKEGDSVNLQYPDSETRRGRVGVGVANTLQCNDGQGVVTENLKIRKLTPKECFRLQGWTDDYFEKAAFVNNDSQLYKQAGNGVTVNVIEAIARYFK